MIHQGAIGVPRGHRSSARGILIGADDGADAQLN